MRSLYLWFLLAFGVMLFGFWPTTVGPFGPPDTIRTVHGVFALAWMGLLVLQSWLIGHGHGRIHRYLGRASLLIAPGLVISAFMVVLDSLPTGGAAHFPRGLLLILVWIDVWSLLLFGLLYGLALAHRRRMFLHARFMAGTVFVALIPALGRAYGMNVPALGGLLGAVNPSFWTVEAVLLFLIVRDWRVGHREVSPWWLTLGGLAMVQVTMTLAPTWPWFISLLTSLGLPAA
ncbi:hypothetical protein [Brevundimonas sp. NIBR11]|uniref:hypothetical protein n=1 Tax=Brevundimonas sp. NIBR11 TaxID=3015999 RepID=UPI0022F13ACF|nr:hypothetical protein [Brevundimonas sp. NIBR11]WGM29960.1 hypothetical protein KKHFBJBL_00174 [Brevundimonas sp. NIBR11]